MNTFLFRGKYWEALKLLEPKQRLEALERIISYGVTGQCVKPSNEIAPICRLICTSIREDQDTYQRRKEEFVENGEKNV